MSAGAYTGWPRLPQIGEIRAGLRDWSRIVMGAPTLRLQAGGTMQILLCCSVNEQSSRQEMRRHSRGRIFRARRAPLPSGTDRMHRGHSIAGSAMDAFIPINICRNPLRCRPETGGFRAPNGAIAATSARSRVQPPRCPPPIGSGQAGGISVWFLAERPVLTTSTLHCA